jgi:signal transduction histidine kinase
MTRSLRLRLLAFSALFVAMALAAVWLTLGALFERQIAAEYEARLGAVVDSLAANLALDPAGGSGSWAIERQPIDPRYGIPGSGEYWQISGPMEKPLRSRSLWDTTLPDGGAPVTEGSKLASLTGPAGDRLVALAADVTVGEGKKSAAFRIVAATSRDSFDAAVAGFESSLVRMLALAGAFLLVASALQVTIGLRPLTALSRQVASIRSGTSRRLADGGPSETVALVREVNQLLEAREHDLEKARNRASDLAHGLKTPLTILSQVAEGMASPAKGLHGNRRRDRQGNGRRTEAGAIAEQVDAIRQRVDRQLALARMSSLHGRRTDLHEAISKLVGVVRQLPSDGPIEWEGRIEKGVGAACDPADFAEATGNVLDNARKFARSLVRVSASQRDGRVVVQVEDDGPGVPEAEIGRILMRGGHLDGRASETGLGLAITADILEAHGGRLTVGNRKEGGLSVRMDWPVAADGRS